MTQYSRGADFERKVKKDLIAHGAMVDRTAGSRGTHDLVAIWPGPEVVLIQCKRDGRMSIEDRRAFVLEGLTYDCTTVLAYSDKGIQYSELSGDQYIDWEPSEDWVRGAA
jgi:hypothetical protein